MQTDTYTAEFEEYLKTVDILYVEDEDRIRELVDARLSKHFGTIHTAPNGEVGLYRFGVYRPKIVITDICMPIMDGLEMLEMIREKSPNVKAIITTAHSDMDYVMKSIDIGIDKYIAKPINIENLIANIKKIAFGFYNENLAKEYQRKSIEEQINSVMKSVFEQMSQSIPNPMVLYSGNRPVFMNSSFISLFSPQIIGRLSGKEMALEDVLEFAKNYGKESKKVVVTLASGRKKIFGITKTDMNIDNHVTAVLYMFNDLTMLEYQNAKLKSHADTLCDLLKIKNVITNVPLYTSTDAANVPLSAEVAPEQKSKTTESASSFLSAYEMEALKRSHSIKVSAKEYAQDISDDIVQELDELSEIESEITEIIERIEDGNVSGQFGELGRRFVAYSRSIGKLIEFEDLAVAVRNFGSFLMQAEGNEEIKWIRLISYAQNIKLDLVSWRNTIFVEHSTQDIHYLDSSLLSSCVQAQLNSSGDGASMEDENDLELF